MAGRQSVFDQQKRSAPSPGLSSHSSYHPHGYGVSEGLKRARRPFAVRNLIMGSILAGTATGLYFYSIYKIKQDDFSDIGIPPQQVPSSVSAEGSLKNATASSASAVDATTAPQAAGKRIV